MDVPWYTPVNVLEYEGPLAPEKKTELRVLGIKDPGGLLCLVDEMARNGGATSTVGSVYA